MPRFLTTAGTSYHIERIITNARERLVLISPYLQMSQILLERLVEANDRGVKIQIVYGKKELSDRELDKVNRLVNLELYFLDNLHAKCYSNEAAVVISSMNMYEFSEKNNREMGILLTRDQDREAFDEAIQEVTSIIRASNMYTTRRGFVQNAPKMHAPGHCIRCNVNIPLNPYMPLCESCHFVWSSWSDIYYPEKHCHECGTYYATSFSAPLCPSCWRKAGMPRFYS